MAELPAPRHFASDGFVGALVVQGRKGTFQSVYEEICDWHPLGDHLISADMSPLPARIPRSRAEAAELFKELLGACDPDGLTSQIVSADNYNDSRHRLATIDAEGLLGTLGAMAEARGLTVTRLPEGKSVSRL
jgi:hypothetical protein